MKVRIETINKGQKMQYHILLTDEKNDSERRVLHSAPNHWKTENGAKRWAEKNGFEVKGKGARKKK